MTGRALTGLLAAALLLTACGDGESDDPAATDDETPTIVVTTSVWADIVEHVTCDGLARVETLIPDGGDPHQFELSLADRGRLDDAEVVVANGLDLEASMNDALATVEADGGTVIRAVTDQATQVAGQIGVELPRASVHNTVSDVLEPAHKALK